MRIRLWFYGIFVAVLLGYGWYATAMPGRSRARSVATPLERGIAAELGGTVRELAGTIGERNLDHPVEIGRARDFLRNALERRSGALARVRLESLGDVGGEADNVVVDWGDTEHETFVLVGAHYDTAPGTPGANDNGSGVAVLLALADRFGQEPPEAPVRFVFFANEEPPYFQTPAMGSWIHARGARARGERIAAMLSLETLGYYTDEEASQHYPFPIGLLYPDRGNFLAFVGNLGSRALVRRSIDIFRSSVEFPSEGAALPETFPGIGWSDHWSFWQEGYPAAMLTDTATYRDPHYHRASDRGDAIDFEALARVTLGVEAIVRGLRAK